MRLVRPALVGLAVVAFAAAPSFVSTHWVSVLTQGLVLALLAASLDLLAGQTGMASLGHAAFYGIAAYVAGYATVRLDWTPWLAGAAAVAGAAALGFAFGLFAVRARALYFLVATLAFGQLLWGLAIKWTSFTGGYNGLPGVGRPELATTDLSEPVTFYRFTAVIVALSLVMVLRIAASPVGLVLRGVQANETRLSFLGYRATAYRLAAFTIASGFAGVAGVLAAYDARFVSPDVFHWVLSAQVLLVVIVGGAGTIWGPAIAGLTLVVAQNLVSERTDRWGLVLGVIYIVTVLAAPNGLAHSVGGAFAKLAGERATIR